MNEAMYRGYKVSSFLPIGEDSKFTVVLYGGNVVEHVHFRKSPACPTEEVALGLGILLVKERAEAHDAAMEELAKEAPVEFSSSTDWIIPDKGLSSA